MTFLERLKRLIEVTINKSSMTNYMPILSNLFTRVEHHYHGPVTIVNVNDEAAASRIVNQCPPVDDTEPDDTPQLLTPPHNDLTI